MRDDRTELSQRDIRFALDGQEHSDDAGAYRLNYDSGWLSLG